MSEHHPLLTIKQWVGTFCLLGAVAAVVFFIYLIPQPSLSVSYAADTLVSSNSEPRDTIAYHRSYKRLPQRHMRVFDPNTADSLTLLGNGLKSWQAHNLIKYRKAGGRFRQPEDIRKLYGLTDAQYRSILPYVRIGGKHNHYRTDTDTVRRDTFPRYVSHKKDTVLELNTADTTQLQMLRGIGRWTAVQIVRYRRQLGGYYSVEQLREIPHIDQQMLDTVLGRLTVDTTLITRLAVNRIGVTGLQRHPYLRFEQAKGIYELRRKRLTLQTIDDLREIPGLGEEDIDKLRHYLSFE